MDELRAQLTASSEFQDMVKAIQTSPSAYPDYTIVNDLVLRKGRIWLPSKLALIPTLLTEFHATPMGDTWELLRQ